MYLENKIADKKPNSGRKIISSVIFWLIFKKFKNFLKHGRGGIRTHEEKFSLVFKTRAFDHSATLPSGTFYETLEISIWAQVDSNYQHYDYQTYTLPLSYEPLKFSFENLLFFFEKGNDGIEPSTFWLTANCSTPELITPWNFYLSILGLEPKTHGLKGRRSTIELYTPVFFEFRKGGNRTPGLKFEASYFTTKLLSFILFWILPIGIQPTFSTWKADVLALDEESFFSNFRVEGFEPPIFCFQSRYFKPTKLHPVFNFWFS